MIAYVCLFAARLVAFPDDPMLAQEKLEWVTPKISLMQSAETDGKINRKVEGTQLGSPAGAS